MFHQIMWSIFLLVPLPSMLYPSEVDTLSISVGLVEVYRNHSHMERRTHKDLTLLCTSRVLE